MKSAVRFAHVFSIAASLLASAPHGNAQQLPAPFLKIDSVSPTGSGTMHFADELRLSVGDFAPLVLKTDVGGGKLIPIPGPQYRIDGRHVLLLGWSSHGGGMQTLHAMLLRVDSGNVTLQRELMLTAARTASALIVRRGGPDQIRLGIGELPDRMWKEGDWQLLLGPDSEQRLDVGGIRKLAFVAEQKRDTDMLYAPAVQNARFPARVTWISVSPSGFAPMPGAR